MLLIYARQFDGSAVLLKWQVTAVFLKTYISFLNLNKRLRLMRF